MTKALIYLALLVCFTQAAIRADIVHKVPVLTHSFRDIVIVFSLMYMLVTSTLQVLTAEFTMSS